MSERWLLDADVLLEIRRRSGNVGVRSWFARAADDSLFTSVIVLAELKRKAASAAAFDRWLKMITRGYPDRILPVDQAVADEWAVLDPRRTFHGLLAATARVHSLTIVTRNEKDFASLHVETLSPFR